MVNILICVNVYIHKQTNYIVLFIHFLFIDEESIDYATNGYSSQKGSIYFIITIT